MSYTAPAKQSGSTEQYVAAFSKLIVAFEFGVMANNSFEITLEDSNSGHCLE